MLVSPLLKESYHYSNSISQYRGKGVCVGLNDGQPNVWLDTTPYIHHLWRQSFAKRLATRHWLHHLAAEYRQYPGKGRIWRPTFSSCSLPDCKSMLHQLLVHWTEALIWLCAFLSNEVCGYWKLYTLYVSGLIWLFVRTILKFPALEIKWKKHIEACE